MKSIVLKLSIVALLVSCKKDDEPRGEMPFRYIEYFTISNIEGVDIFKDWTEEDLKTIRYKTFTRLPEGLIEADWKPFGTQIIKNDTTTVFMFSLPEKMLINYPTVNHTDTVTKTQVYDEERNKILNRKFYFNSDFVEEFDFVKDPGLLRRLDSTNRYTLKPDSYILKFIRK